jgi:hypothetical protein
MCRADGARHVRGAVVPRLAPWARFCRASGCRLWREALVKKHDFSPDPPKSLKSMTTIPPPFALKCLRNHNPAFGGNQ